MAAVPDGGAVQTPADSACDPLTGPHGDTAMRDTSEVVGPGDTPAPELVTLEDLLEQQRANAAWLFQQSRVVAAQSGEAAVPAFQKTAREVMGHDIVDRQVAEARIRGHLTRARANAIFLEVMRERGLVPLSDLARSPCP
jgi:hypothetical protein